MLGRLYLLEDWGWNNFLEGTAGVHDLLQITHKDMDFNANH